MSYGGPGFPYKEWRDAIYAACLECRDLGLLAPSIDTDPHVLSIVDKHLAPFKQWKLGNEKTSSDTGTDSSPNRAS